MRGFICMAAKRKENFIITMHHMIFDFASKRERLDFAPAQHTRS